MLRSLRYPAPVRYLQRAAFKTAQSAVAAVLGDVVRLPLDDDPSDCTSSSDLAHLAAKLAPMCHHGGWGDRSRNTLLEDLPEVTTVSGTDGLEAIQMVSQERPDLVLLDIMMPKMSGFEVCKQIKANPETRHIQVVMVTALSETGDIERATECGTDDYLTKPIDRKALVELVRTMLQARPH